MTAALKLLLCTFVLLFSGSNGYSYFYYDDLENELTTLSKEFFYGVCYVDLIWSIINGYVTPRCRSVRYYHREQTRGDYKWCVYDDGVPVAHTLEEIRFFPYDCDETIDCEDNTVYEITGRCEMTCDQAKSHTKLSFTYGCRNKCICPRGWFRNMDDKCVRKSECESELYNCPAPKIYAKCATRCPATCGVPKPGLCTKPCNENLHCVCPWDMVQISADNRKCVKREDCPTLCKSPRVRTQGCGSSCQPTCEDMKPTCAKNCVKKNTCSCPDGFIQRSQKDKKCIKIENCPPKKECEKPKVPVKCDSTCPKTCNDRVLCARDCNEKYTCECPKGYVQISEDNTKCVKENECPPTCKFPRVPAECRTSCPPSCASLCRLDTDALPQCREQCLPSVNAFCVCGEGYVEGYDGECVKSENCPPCPSRTPPATCKFPRVPAECRTSCPPSCASLCRLDTDPLPQCREQCKKSLKAFCVCGEGYVVGYDGECVKPENCPPCPSPTPPVKCKAPLVADRCPTLCPPTCQNPEPKECPEGCNEDKCVCPKGKILLNNEKTKICLDPSECPGTCEETHIPILCDGKCPDTCIKDVSYCERDCEAKYICGCPAGLVQISHVKTKCVRKNECPAPCKAPKRYATCASLCQPTCQNQNPGSCRRGCNPNKCVCPRGMVQPDDDTLTCIKPEECRKNCDAPKVHVKCPTKCPPTCENRAPDKRKCERGCDKNKCVCPALLLLVSETNRTCVKPYQCPVQSGRALTIEEATCRHPRVPVKCRSPCVKTCASLYRNDIDDHPSCKKECGKTSDSFCVCAQGYVQRSVVDLTCVRIQDCPTPAPPAKLEEQCEEPKVFTKCATKCPPTCMEPNPRICSRACDVNVLCVCPYGMVQRSKVDTTCIKLEDCPGEKKECTKPKIYVDCASKCRPTCQTPNPVFCKKGCDEDVHCVCPPGWVHPTGQDNSCIKLSDCPQSCGFLLKPTSCASSCPPTCDDPVPKCNKRCNKDIKCECQLGLLQHSATNRTCLFPSQCPGLPKYCPGRKVPTRCASACPATCQNRIPGFCKKPCRQDVNCECPSGMVQISLEDDTCIWPGDC